MWPLNRHLLPTLLFPYFLQTGFEILKNVNYVKKPKLAVKTNCVSYKRVYFWNKCLPVRLPVIICGTVEENIHLKSADEEHEPGYFHQVFSNPCAATLLYHYSTCLSFSNCKYPVTMPHRRFNALTDAMHSHIITHTQNAPSHVPLCFNKLVSFDSSKSIFFSTWSLWYKQNKRKKRKVFPALISSPMPHYSCT